MIELVGNVLKVTLRDIVIRFNSLAFAWTAFFGFSVHRETLFAQVALSGFQLAVCTDFFYFFIFIYP